MKIFFSFWLLLALFFFFHLTSQQQEFKFDSTDKKVTLMAFSNGTLGVFTMMPGYLAVQNVSVDGSSLGTSKNLFIISSCDITQLSGGGVAIVYIDMSQNAFYRVYEEDVTTIRKVETKFYAVGSAVSIFKIMPLRSTGGFAIFYTLTTYDGIHMQTYDQNGSLIIDVTLSVTDGSYVKLFSGVEIASSKIFLVLNHEYYGGLTSHFIKLMVVDTTGTIINQPWMYNTSGLNPKSNAFFENYGSVTLAPSGNSVLFVMQWFVDVSQKAIVKFAFYDMNGNIKNTETSVQLSTANGEIFPIARCPKSSGNCSIIFLNPYDSWKIQLINEGSGNIVGDIIPTFFFSISYLQDSYRADLVFFPDGSKMLIGSSSIYGIYLLRFNSEWTKLYSVPNCTSYISADMTQCKTISGCDTYLANRTGCDVCNPGLHITEGKIACATTLPGCGVYNDNGTCKSCESGKALSEGKACVTAIAGCDIYKDAGGCKTCLPSKSLSSDLSTCVNTIENCLNHSNTNTCEACNNPFVRTSGSLACAAQIASCVTYSDNKLCSTCSGDLVLSVDFLACATPIENCSEYSNDTKCSSCKPDFQLTISKTKCAPIISNCSTYSDDKKCSLCSLTTALTVGKTKCANKIENCQNYSDDGNCTSCIPNLFLIIDKQKCTTEILNCLTYSDDATTCVTCASTKVSTSGKKACVTPIENCVNYSDDGNCTSCVPSLFLIAEKQKCGTEILNCLNYSDDVTTCVTCVQSKVLTSGKKACANEIANCINYTDDKKCSKCSSSTTLSNDLLGCVNTMDDCITYTSDGLCSQCLPGANLAGNKSVCLLPSNSSDPSYNSSIYSRVSLNFSDLTNNSFLDNGNSHEISVTLTNITNYKVALKNSSVKFTSVKSNSSMIIQIESSENKDSLGVLNLKDVPKDYYRCLFGLNLNKIQNRILEQNLDTSSLPDSFSLTYQAKDTYFIGSKAEIQKEMSGSSGSTNHDDGNGFDSELFAILFSIFGFIFVVVVILVVRHFLKKKNLGKNKDKKTEFVQVPQSPDGQTQV